MSDISGTSSTPTGMTGAGGGQLLRITGMASGLDVDAMVKKMMAAEQTKLDKAKQDQQTIQWKQEAYQGIIKEIKDLQSSFFDSASSANNILSSTNFSPFTVSGGDASVATFTPGVGVQTGSYSITVNKLATGAGISNTLSGKTLTTKLTDIDASLTGSISLVLNANGAGNDTTITLDNTSGNKTLGDLISAINNQGGGSVRASFSELTGEFKLNSTTTGSTTSLAIKGGTTAGLSSILGNNIIGQTIDSSIDTSTYTTARKGQDANVTITPPGVSSGSGTTVTKSTNNFTIDGMSYVLSSTGTTTVSVGADTQKVYDKIKGFIDKYNTIIDEIQTKLTEKKDSNYKPLTDSQKSSMSDSQITAWETKAKVGILRNDDNLQNLLSDLRTAFTTAVNNTGLTFGSYGSNSFGIDTSKDYTKPGHIDIADSSKLKAAISNNADQILKIFTNVSSATDGSTSYNSNTTQYKEDGIFTRINTILQNNVGYTNTTLNTAILTSYANTQYDYSYTGGSGKNTLPDQLYAKQLMIKSITDSMNTKQEKYYQQFSQLETAMNQLNAQQAQLSSMLGG